MSTIHISTADQLLGHSAELGRCELVRGELRFMSPTKLPHGIVSATVASLLREYVRSRRLGIVVGGEAGFCIERNPDTVRAPDAAFVTRSRVPFPRPKGFFPGAPNLAVEVLSPSDRPTEVQAKVQMWLTTGCQLVWVVDPAARTVTASRTGTPDVTLSARERISGEDVIPGFEIEVAEFFVDLDD